MTDKFDIIRPGDSHTLEKQITAEMVGLFAGFSGDYNPVHTDEEYCREHGLGTPMVHGMLYLSFLSTLIGMHLPGEGAVWMSQNIDFISPVRAGDTVKITGTVTKKNRSPALSLDIIEMKIAVTDQNNRKIARGNVKVSIK